MVKLFFSYSHKDEGLRDELEKHLSILKRTGVISTWHDRRIDAGTKLDDEISYNLSSAHIILLLISADFLASDYCYEKEMMEALKKHENGTATVVPIILRPCDWHQTPFGKLLAIPKEGKPVTKYSALDDAFLEITQELKKVASKYQQASEKEYNTIDKIKSGDQQLPRSSNVRVKKNFTDHDQDKFLNEAFEYIANYFEESLKELKKRNGFVDSLFKRVDAQTFQASVYSNGQLKSECMVYQGSMFNSRSINYSRSISSGRSSLNESLSINHDGYIIYLQPIGISFNHSNQFKNLTEEGGAEYFWEIFIKPLQQ